MIKEMPFKDFPTFSSGGHFVLAIIIILVEDIMRNISEKLLDFDPVV